VTEPAHHDADDGFHEIQLSGKQLVFLFMAGTTVAVMIFLCGVWVGRGVPADRGVGGDNPDTMAAATPAPASAQPVGSSGPPSAEPPAPARDDELSYAKRLQAESVQTEKLKSPQTTPKAATPAAPPPPPKEQPSTPEKPAAPQAKPEPATPQMTARAGAWVVQVVSLQDRSSATAIARRLSAKGYPAFVLDPAAGGPRIFRVQVGGYTDKNEAEQASRRLERDEQFKPFVRAR
jgi:cell division septation protein DedD